MSDLELFLVVCGLACTYIAPIAVIAAVGERFLNKIIKSKEE